VASSSDQRSRASRRKGLLYGLLALAAVAVVLLGLDSVYNFFGTSSSNSATQRTATVALGTVQSSVSASGNVSVAVSASANFATSGTLASVDVAVGDKVRAGQIIAKLDPTSAEATLEASQASLAQAEATLAATQAGPTDAQKAANASSLQQAQSQVTSAQQQLATDQAAVTAAENQLAVDEALDCPPVGASGSSGSNASGAASTGSGNSSSAASSAGSSAAGSSSTGSSSANPSGSSSVGGSSGSSGGSAASGSPTGATRNGLAVVSSSAAQPATTPTGSGTAGASGTASTPTGSGTAGASGTASTPTGSGTAGASGTPSTPASTSTTPTTSAATGQVSSVGPTSATFGGSVGPAGLATSYWFEYGRSATSLSAQTAKAAAGSGSQSVPVSVSVTGLQPDSNYLVQLVASNSAGTTYGGLQLFKTSGTTQSATTGAVSSVGATSATLGGTVSPSGLDTSYWFAYGTSASSLSSATAKQDAGAGSGQLAVSSTVTGLRAGKGYYFRLVASNASGTSEGATVSFATSAAALPAVVTGSASDVLTSTLTLNGTVNPNGSSTTFYFEYGTTSAYGSRTSSQSAGSASGATAVSAQVSGLKPDTSYLFRLVATNPSGTSTGIGQVVKTSASSCVADQAAITAAKQTVSQQEQAVKTAEANLTQTETTIAEGATPTAATIAQDQAAVTQARATVTADEKALAETTLLAPVPGTVTAVNGSVGDTVGGTGSSVSRGAANAAATGSSGAGAAAEGSTASTSASSSTFATIETLNALEVVSGFAEADATKLAVGQPATITFPALTDVSVAGRVTAVATTSTVVSNVVTYNATIALINPPTDVLEGMTANVAVVVDTRSHVMQLPSSAITTNGTLSTVQLLNNGSTTATRIQTGLVGDSSTEIVSGLHLGDVVVIPTVSISAAATTTGGTGASIFGGGGLGGGGGFAGGGGGFGGGGRGG
jgi:trimeric autotransporter adhesin